MPRKKSSPVDTNAPQADIASPAKIVKRATKKTTPVASITIPKKARFSSETFSRPSSSPDSSSSVPARAIDRTQIQRSRSESLSVTSPVDTVTHTSESDGVVTPRVRLSHRESQSLVGTLPRKKRSLIRLVSLHRTKILYGVAILGFLLGGDLLRVQIQEARLAKKTTQDSYVSIVQEMVELPAGSRPDVGIIKDPTEILKTPGFSSVVANDIILVYNDAKKIVVYRPETRRIVVVAGME